MGLPRSISHPIPRNRDTHRNPKARTIVAAFTQVSLDADALLDVATAYRRGEEESERLYGWLKAKNAIAAQGHVQDVRDQIERDRHVLNGHLASELDRLKDERRELRIREAGCAPEAHMLAAQLGIEWKAPCSVLPLAHNEPVSLRELAGQEGYPEPQSENHVESKTLHRLASVGGGVLFGISLGLLSGQIEMTSLDRQLVPLLILCATGIVVMMIIGAAVVPIARLCGGRLYQTGVTLQRMKSVAGWTWIALLVFLSGAMLFIESKIEQLGLLKGLTESSSYHGVHISSGDLGWVSLMLILPVMSFYVLTSIAAGYHGSNVCKLEGEWKRRRNEFVAGAQFGRLIQLCTLLKPITSQLAAVESEIKSVESRIRWTKTQSELEREEDVETDSIAYSREFEMCLVNPRSFPAWIRQHDRPSSWRAWLAKWLSR